MAIHSSVLAWRVPWTEEPGRLQSLGSQRVGQDSTIHTFTFHKNSVGSASNYPLFTFEEGSTKKLSHSQLVVANLRPTLDNIRLEYWNVVIERFLLAKLPTHALIPPGSHDIIPFSSLWFPFLSFPFISGPDVDFTSLLSTVVFPPVQDPLFRLFRGQYLLLYEA